jgi:hypothetical protein
MNGCHINSTKERNLARLTAVAFVLAAIGCAHTVTAPRPNVQPPGVRKPANEDERQLLQSLSSLPAGQVQRVGELTVVSAVPYVAASGRTCRSLDLTAPGQAVARPQLACLSTDGWVFVLDVFSEDVTKDAQR